MGWLFYHRDKGETNADHFAEKFDAHYEMVASGTVDHVFYAAVRDKRSNAVEGFLALTQWVPNDYFNFGYKDLSETCGSGQYKAPENVLNALTPTDDPAALEWRDGCRRYHEQRKALRGLRDGDQIVMSRPVQFTNGAEIDTFTIRRVPTAGGRTKVVLTHGWVTYNFPRWRESGVVAIIRGGERFETPAGRRQEESQYAHRVERLYRYGQGDQVNEALADRYGKRAAYSALGYLARVEFREGRRWDRLEWAESLRASQNGAAVA